MSTTTPDTATSEASDATGATRASLLDKPVYQYYVLAILFFGYVFNVIDRSSLLGIVLPSIKNEIPMSNFLLGTLSGFAFSLFYSFFGFPLARLADRWSRVNVLAIAIALWSTATATCGLAFNYLSLFASRAFTAIGESGGSPPSHSLISDYFPRSRRATALAVYAMAVPVGAAIGNWIGGWLNLTYGWRMTFALVGIPGALFAGLVWLTIKEPPRGHSDGPGAKTNAEAPPFFDVFRFLIARNSFMHMSLAAALHAFVWYSGSAFNGAYFQWQHGLDSKQAGFYLAIAQVVGAVGGFAGGFLSDRFSTKNNDPRWYMWVPGIACVVMVPFQFAAYLSHDFAVIVPTFSLMFLLASMFFGPSFAVAQSIATVRMRAVSASVLLFIQTFIGGTLGSMIVGGASDLLEPTVGRGNGIAYALAGFGILNLWAAYHYMMAARRYREDLAETAKLNAALR